MKNASNGISLLLITLWPFISLSGLTIFLFLWGYTVRPASYTYSMDGAFLADASTTVIGHVISFLVTPILVYLLARKVALHKIVTISLAAMGTLVILGQFYLRLQNVGLSHIDCNYECSNTILPKVLDDVISTYTIVALLVTHLLVIGFFVYRHVSHRSNKPATQKV